MNKKWIIAELRRSAVEDEDPWTDLHQLAWGIDYVWGNGDPWAWCGKTEDDLRTFYLIVAHAMEDE